jgi:hypothetical protein
MSMASPPRSHVANLENPSICAAEAIDLLLLRLPMVNSTENIAARPEESKCFPQRPGVRRDLQEDYQNFQQIDN